MAHPDLRKSYRLYTDASDIAVGAILVQLDEEGVERPIQYISRCFRGTETRWSTIEMEAFAIIFALKKLRPYLFGAKFVIYTDHKPLKSLFLGEVRNTKIQRWASLIAEYAAPIEHRKGKLNVRAKMLSRISNEIAETHEWVDAATRPGDTLPWIQDDLDRLQMSHDQRAMHEWDRAGEGESQYEIIGDLLWSRLKL